MRLTILFLFVGLMQVSASLYSQNTKLNLYFHNTSMLEVLEAIEKQSEFRFAYSPKYIDMERKVDVEVKEKSIEQTLSILFNSTEVNYTINDRHIMLFIANEQTNPAQQQNRVSGKITDSTGASLPGVSVVVKGTTIGVITDNSGKYSFSDIPENATLKFSFVGMKAEEVKVGSQTSINVVLNEETVGIEEVVAIGYGTIKKKDLTGSVSSIKSEDLVKVPVLGVNQAIQGRAPGVYVSNNQSQPGGNVTVRIRGTNSIQGNNEPLYIIDGFVGGNLNTVEPSDIQSVEILKDASSTAIYGARGANGVIIVTTKSGKTGKNSISFDAYFGVQTVAKKLDLMDAHEFAVFANGVNQSLGKSPLYPDVDNLPASTDWQDEIFRLAPMQNYSISSNGGTDKLTYYISGNYIQQDGVVEETGYNRFNLRINIDSKLSEFVNIGARMGVSRTNRTLNYEETEGESNTKHPVATAIEIAPTISPYGSDGELLSEILKTDGFSWPNPMFMLKNIDSHSYNSIVNGNLFAEFKILKDLKFRSTFGFGIDTWKQNRYKPSIVFEVNDGYRNRANINMDIGTTWLSENYLTFDKTMGINKLQVMGGFTANKYYEETIGASVTDFAVDDFSYHNLSAGDNLTDQISSGMSHWSRASVYGRVQYNLKEKYLITLNSRYDGSSRFGKNNKWAFFPSGALAWRISEEPFIKDLGVFSSLKFRGSYGISGSEALGPFSSFSQMTSRSNSGYILGGNVVVGFIPTKLPNPDLRWEQTSQLDIGLDASFWGGRLNVVTDYYHKVTSDLFLDRPIPKTNGVAVITQNVGSLMNEGVELGINWVVLDQKLKWETEFNVTTQKSEIIDLGFDDSVAEQQILLGSLGGNIKLGDMQIMRVGEPLGVFYGYKTDGVWQENEIATAWTQFGAAVKAGDLKIVNQNNDTNINDADRTIIGYAQPKYFGGFNNKLSYGSFDFSVFMQYALDNNVLNASRYRNLDMGYLSNKLREALDAWTPQNTNTNIPRVGYAQPGIISDQLVEAASFLRVREVTFGYSLPQKLTSRMKVSRFRVYASASNLYTFTKYSGYDPEVNIYGGSITNINTDNGSYPRSRILLFGLNLTL